MAKSIHLCSTQHLKTVESYLHSLERVIVPMDRGSNNLIEAIMIQLLYAQKFHTQDHATSDGFILCGSVDYLYPKINCYLKSKNLTYTSYVMDIYDGHVWGDTIF